MSRRARPEKSFVVRWSCLYFDTNFNVGIPNSPIECCCHLRPKTGKGGKNRRRGKGDGEETKRELEFKEEGQEYAQVVKMLGNGRCECFCFDGVTRLGHIRGKMRKKVWVTAGDIVLVGKRDFQDEKVDIIHKYSADEARNLKQYGELPETARINETAVDLAMTAEGEDDDIGIDFDDI
mmetsp:Transcript_30931/g.62775  ORF Transcript_30931/g.62775 Transcript_30931/m.62775 type:complete len:179 (+) Transcript_30931:1677-2213(+)